MEYDHEEDDSFTFIRNADISDDAGHRHGHRTGRVNGTIAGTGVSRMRGAVARDPDLSLRTDDDDSAAKRPCRR